MMETGISLSPPELRTIAILAVLYLTVVPAAYARLFGHVSRSSRWLATVLLAAQVFAVVMSIALRPASEYGWAFDVDREWNLATVLASAQLALVGATAMLTAVAGRQRPTWARLYFVVLSVAFFYLDRDEYAMIHEAVPGWERRIAALGLVLAWATAIVAWRSPRRSRRWYVCLLAGLALSGGGALIVEQYRHFGECFGYGFWHGRCLLAVIEEAMEFLGIWLALVALLGLYSPSAPRRYMRFCIPLVLALWVLLHPPLALYQYLEYRFGAQRVEVRYEGAVGLNAINVNRAAAAIEITLVISPKTWRDYTGLGYSIHLVDQASGASLASLDQPARRNWGGKFGGSQIYITKTELKLPQQMETNRAVWVVLTLVRQAGQAYPRQRILSSDLPLLDDTQVVLGELVLPATASATPINRVLADFDGGFSLGAVELPASAQAGKTLMIPFSWRARSASAEDYMQFLHFQHLASGAWRVFDQEPLGPRLPTRLWYAGLAETEVWEIPLPVDFAPGRYDVYTGLYRASDLERLPASAIDGTAFADGRVKLGSLIVEEP